MPFLLFYTILCIHINCRELFVYLTCMYIVVSRLTLPVCVFFFFLYIQFPPYLRVFVVVEFIFLQHKPPLDPFTRQSFMPFSVFPKPALTVSLAKSLHEMRRFVAVKQKKGNYIVHWYAHTNVHGTTKQEYRCTICILLVKVPWHFY